jgi:hypothetical protein
MVRVNKTRRADYGLRPLRQILDYTTARCNVRLNNHQLKAGGLLIGGLNRRLEEKTTESRWFLTTSYRTFVRAKAALMENKFLHPVKPIYQPINTS